MPKVAERADQRLLDLPQIPVQIALVALEIDDRIADELPGPVERDVAATLDLEQLDAARSRAAPATRAGAAPSPSGRA